MSRDFAIYDHAERDGVDSPAPLPPLLHGEVTRGITQMAETAEGTVFTFTIFRTRGDTQGSTGGDTRDHAAAEAPSCEAPPLTITLPAGPSTTVLDILERVRRSHDPSLMYRHSCHHGSCGTCACPGTEGYMGPASLAFLHMEAQNNPERRGRLLAIASGERGVRKCIRALECSKV